MRGHKVQLESSRSFKAKMDMDQIQTWRVNSTVDPVTNDLASARQKKSLVTESRWSQE